MNLQEKNTTHMCMIAGKVFRLKEPMIWVHLMTICEAFVSFSSDLGKPVIRAIKMRNPADMFEIVDSYSKDSAEILDASSYTPQTLQELLLKLIAERKGLTGAPQVQTSAKNSHALESIKAAIKSHLISSDTAFAEILEDNFLAVDGPVNLDWLAEEVLNSIPKTPSVLNPAEQGQDRLDPEQAEWAVGTFTSSNDSTKLVKVLVQGEDFKNYRVHYSFKHWDYAHPKA